MPLVPASKEHVWNLLGPIADRVWSCWAAPARQCSGRELAFYSRRRSPSSPYHFSVLAYLPTGSACTASTGSILQRRLPPIDGSNGHIGSVGSFSQAY